MVNEQDRIEFKKALDIQLFAGFEFSVENAAKYARDVKQPMIQTAQLAAAELSMATIVETEPYIGEIDDPFFVPRFSLELKIDKKVENTVTDDEDQTKFESDSVSSKVYIIQDSRVPEKFEVGPPVVSGICSHCFFHVIECNCSYIKTSNAIPMEWQSSVREIMKQMPHAHDDDESKFNAAKCEIPRVDTRKIKIAILLNSKFYLSFKRVNLRLPGNRVQLSCDFIKPSNSIVKLMKKKKIMMFQHDDKYIDLLMRFQDDDKFYDGFPIILNLLDEYVSCYDTLKLISGIPESAEEFKYYKCKIKSEHPCVQNLIRRFSTLTIFSAFQIMSGRFYDFNFLRENEYDPPNDIFHWKIPDTRYQM